MVDRIKMARRDRAKQFNPFDALKGLQDALRIIEYEHARVSKGDVSEEKAEKISHMLMDMNNGDLLEITFYQEGHYVSIYGKCWLLIEEHCIRVENATVKIKINLDDLFDIN